MPERMHYSLEAHKAAGKNSITENHVHDPGPKSKTDVGQECIDEEGDEKLFPHLLLKRLVPLYERQLSHPKDQERGPATVHQQEYKILLLED
eukprot:CAMPEP_0118640438 /NCGR_PEP_ID=MMETSP0785-20121206/4755_1 /TAXON_ID=91992 /ORGANISM="Bolidomonas pacifica, Strain CCMP 1866" /LENGTH=91 /DNA_ID=CAMNT_0006531829 /DNA_START=335 /DNA_END=610 /DNA_ORIENTATION=-